MKTEYDYMKFVLIKDTGKTTQWSIHNKRTDAVLGEIKWYGAWRSYCFFTGPGAIFNDGCLSDIINFIGQLNAARKEKYSPFSEPQKYHESIAG